MKIIRNRTNMISRLRNLVLPVLLIAIVTASSCNKIKKPEVLIGPENMTSILTDLYLADGLLSLPYIRRDFQHADSIENYISVIGKHDYTITEFEASIEYYFMAEPKKYEQIYDAVIATLSAMESESIQAKKKENPDNENLWNGKIAYRMPDDGTSNPVEFEIPVRGPGVYTIRARLTLYEDDQSINPRSTIYFWYDDGTEEGHRDMWDSVEYEKSRRSQQLRFRKKLEDTLVTHIKGRLMDFSPQPGHWEMHSSISGIFVRYIPAGSGDDTLEELE